MSLIEADLLPKQATFEYNLKNQHELLNEAVCFQGSCRYGRSINLICQIIIIYLKNQ